MDDDPKPLDPSDLEQRLSDAFEKSKLALPAKCVAAEGLILKAARSAALAEVRAFASKTNKEFRSDATGDYFDLDRARFSIRLAPQSAKPNTLHVLVASTDQRQPMDHATVQRVRSSGRITRIKTTTAGILAPAKDAIAVEVQKVIKSGYRCLQACVNASLEELQHGCAMHLYAEIRKRFSEQLAPQIWLYVVMEREAFYILDPSARQTALTNALQSDIAVELSALEKLAIFCTTNLDPEKEELYARKALESGETIDVYFSSRTYDRRFQIAEEEVYKARIFTVQPLVRDGQCLMVAAYPQHVRPHIEPILRQQCEALRRRLNERLNELRQIGRQLQPVGLGHRISDWVGWGFAGFVKNLSSP